MRGMHVQAISDVDGSKLSMKKSYAYIGWRLVLGYMTANQRQPRRTRERKDVHVLVLLIPSPL